MKRTKLSFIPNKIAIWFAVFVIGALSFTLLRLSMLLTHWASVDRSPIGEILKSFLIGFRFDSVVLSMIILPLFLVSLLPFIKFSTRFTRNIFIAILTAIFALTFLISAADLRFFDHFGNRMNYWAIEYTEEPGIFFYSIVTDSSFWKLLPLWLTMSILFFFAVRKIFVKLAGFNVSVAALPKIVAYSLAILLLAFGIRGRIGIKALDWGSAVFSENQFLNQLALNSVFSLTHSTYEELRDGKSLFGQTTRRFAFYDDEEAYQAVVDLLGLDSNVATDNFSLTRNIKRQGKIGFLPNVVILIMESWASDKIGVLGSNLDVSPEFDKLSPHGILFPNFYANGIRTNRGIPAVLCSFPSLPGRSIMKRYAADRPFRSIAEILTEYNYTSIFAYGGDMEFDNIRGFLKSVGYDEFYSGSDFKRSERLGKWGAPDHIVFGRLIKEIQNFKRPFNLTVLTLSNHEPYLVPDDRFELYDDTIPDSKILNTFYYSDWALGQFMDSLKRYPVFDSTIFIFTADHYPHQSSQYALDPGRFRVPLFIYAPKILSGRVGIIRKTGSQVDILPTLTGIMGIDTELHCWGRDLLSIPENDQGFAVIVADKKLGLIEGDKFYLHWVDAATMLFDLNDEPYLENNLIDSFPALADRMDKRLNSYIQLANYLSRGGRKKQ